MKFKSKIDEVQFNLLGLNEVEVRKRLSLVNVKTAKDHKASREMSNRWRRSKHEMEKGIKKWNKSTQGKRFHRALGRFNALRESVSGSYSAYETDLAPGEQTMYLTMSQVNDALLGLSSIETHLYLELQYYEADAEAMVQFLDLLEAFTEDASELKIELIEAYTTGVIVESSYGLLTDMIQYFQDPKMYMYAKRDLKHLSNDQDDDIFRAMMKSVQSTDILAPSRQTYEELDRQFDIILNK